MATSSSQSLRISTSKQAAKLTPAQKKFNTLIGRIDRQRKRLAEWQEILRRISWAKKYQVIFVGGVAGAGHSR